MRERERENMGREGGRIRFLLGKAGRREDSSFLIQGVFRPGGVTAALSLAWI